MGRACLLVLLLWAPFGDISAADQGAPVAHPGMSTPPIWIESRAAVTRAVVELYGLSESPEYKHPRQAGVAGIQSLPVSIPWPIEGHGGQARKQVGAFWKTWVW